MAIRLFVMINIFVIQIYLKVREGARDELSPRYVPRDRPNPIIANFKKKRRALTRISGSGHPVRAFTSLSARLTDFLLGCHYPTAWILEL